MVLAMFTLPAKAEICQSWVLSWTEFGKPFQEKAYYCLDLKEGTLFDPKCPKEKILDRLILQDAINEMNTRTSAGTTAFRVCHALKGSPQILKIKGNGISKSQTFDRCRLPNGCTLDTESLLKIIKQR